MFKNIALLLVVAILFSSCATTETNKAQTGVVGGAAAGALLGQIIGKDTEATLLGAAIGGVLGYIVGNEMDKYDRRQLNAAYEGTPSYKTSTWVNPDSGKSYSVTPQPAYRVDDRVCRKAEIYAVIDGKKQKTLATACRNEQGQWVLQQ
jgi:surface antigen